MSSNYFLPIETCNSEYEMGVGNYKNNDYNETAQVASFCWVLKPTLVI